MFRKISYGGKLAPTQQTSPGTTPARVHSMHLSLKNVSIHFPSFYYLAWKLAGKDFSRCKLWSCSRNYSHFQVIRSSQFPRPIPRTTFGMQIALNTPLRIANMWGGGNKGNVGRVRIKNRLSTLNACRNEAAAY